MPANKVQFNPTKTWIEYVNRLLGVLTGLFIVIAALLAWRTYGFNSITWLSFAAAILTAFQGWIGAKVVSTVLAPVMISVHMVLAQVIVFLLLAALWGSLRQEVRLVNARQMRFWAGILLVLFFSQLFLGIAVRQQVDFMRNTLQLPSAYIVRSFGWEFYVHRSFSILLTLLACYFGIVFHRRESNSLIRSLWITVILITLMETVFGVSLYYFNLPPALQALHLLFASILLGAIFSIFLVASRNKTGSLQSL